MDHESGWTLIAEFAAAYEAELPTSMLEAESIPVLRKGPETGIYGPGFAGTSALGVRLYVPHSRLEDARSILEPEPDTSV